MEKINIAELLRDCPQGMELDCTSYDNVSFDKISDDKKATYPIFCYITDKEGNRSSISFTENGCESKRYGAKCVIFPKGKTTWEKFQFPFKDGDIIFNHFIDAFAIFCKQTDKATVSHCFLNAFKELKILHYHSKFLSDWRLATEEEKQALFDAIRENGYEWNEETKTLEKLPMFKVGDKIRHKENNGIYCTLGEYADGISAYRTNIGLSLTYKDLEQWELVPNKFDISKFKPFDKVLVRDFDNGIWEINFFSRLLDGKHFKCLDLSYVQCIPYEGNQHLLGTTNDCADFYKTWQK